LAIAMGSAALCGWVFDVPALKSFVPGLPGIRPNAAVLFVLLGLSLLFHRTRTFGVLGPVAVATIATLTLIENAGLNLGIDELLFRAGDPHTTFAPGRIPTAAGIAFLLLACALLLVRRGGRAAETAQPLALAAGALAWLGIVGYASGVSGLDGLPAVLTPVALNGSIGMIAVVVGVLALRPDEGLVRLVTSSMPGGWLLRVLGPIAILAPTLLTWLSHLGETSGLYRNEVGDLLLGFVLVLVLLAALGVAASAIQRSARAHAWAVAAGLEGAFVLPFVEGVKDHAIVGIDTEGHVIHWNAGAERLYGYTKDEILGAPSAVLYPPVAEEGLPEQELATVLARGFDHVEGLRRRKDGTQFLADISITAIHDEAKGLVGFTKVARDITEARRAEVARGQAEEVLRQRTADLSAANEDLSTRTVELSAANEDLSTRTVELSAANEDLSTRTVELSAANEDLSTRTVELSAANEDLSTRTVELSAANEGLSTRTVELSTRTVELSAANHDLSTRTVELSSANEHLSARTVELSTRTADLSAANEELEAFAYSVSHDLRAPLRALDGFSQVVLEEYSESLDETGQDYLIRLRAASQRMGVLIDDMLSLSRVSRVEMSRVRVDMSAIATSITAELQEREPGREVEFVIEDGVMALGDPRFLRIVLENSLANAFKFTSTRPAARIEFGREEVDGEVVYFVRDNGVGFDMAYSDQLFVPFHRLHREIDFPGSGIGLATIRRVVGRHGGRAWAHGQVGRGATFHFTLGGTVDQ
jgi:PAS domain S-box-containing protein